MNVNYNRQNLGHIPVSAFRAMGRESMRGRLNTVIIVGLIYTIAQSLPSLITTLINPGITSVYPGGDYFGDFIDNAVEASPIITISESALSIASLLIAGPLALGIAYCYLGFRRRREVSGAYVFSGFSNFWRAVGLILLQGVFIFLWALLLIIPGIIAAYRYKLAFFVMADNPQISPIEAIRVSKYLTSGNKGKLFLLDLSFIGWAILLVIAISLISVPTGFLIAWGMPGIGIEAVTTFISAIISAIPAGILAVYMGVSEAAFYEGVSGFYQNASNQNVS